MKLAHLYILAIIISMCPIVTTADDAADALAKESAEKAKTTASTKATPQLLMEKVRKAAELVKEKGKDSFPAFKGKDSDFIFAGTYIWIHNLDGVMLMHPMKYKMEGKEMLGLKDAKGKAIFIDMNKSVTESPNGEGWCEYVWPKPGEKKPSPKVSFVKLVKSGDDNYVVGAGAYDISMEEIEAAMKK